MKLPRMIRNLWIYRKVILLAIVVGVVVSFLWTNKREVDVNFPFVGTITSYLGIVMMVSAALGAGLTWMVMTFRFSIQQARQDQAETTLATEPADDESKRAESPEPPANQALASFNNSPHDRLLDPRQIAPAISVNFNALGPATPGLVSCRRQNPPSDRIVYDHLER